jgi:teichuronic acid biosynthesis glycosyltransferase TuaG
MGERHLANNPLVSIVIPTYNAAEFLSETVESVLNQTYQDWEMLIVDDGSADSTLSIAKGFATKDTRIRVFSLGYNSGGPATPRNFGIRCAGGSYIAFLDSDDLWLPEKLQKQVDYLETNQDSFLLYSKCIVQEAGRQLRTEPKHPKSGYIFKDLFVNFNVIPCMTVILRNEKDGSPYYFDEDAKLVAVEDYAMWLSIARDKQVSYLDEPLAIYRVHANGIAFGPFNNFRKCKLVIKKFRAHVSYSVLMRSYIHFYARLCRIGAMVIMINAKHKIFALAKRCENAE